LIETTMSNYSKIQFISWELHTGPFVVNQVPASGMYSGLFGPGGDKRNDALGQCWDIQNRLAYTADAIVKAEAKSDRGAGTLKVFMAPEFLFRGAGGAYLHDLIDGWDSHAPATFNLPAPFSGRWGGLFGGLRELAAKPQFEDWLFVFGTALSASFPTAKASDGHYLLDLLAPGEIYNIALIQRGGAGHQADNYVSRKHYISGIDFINWNGAVRQHTPGTVLPADPAALVPADAMGVTEGGAVFRIPSIADAAGKPIDFGIEICLDHARSGGNGANQFGRIRTANQYVKVQLVPSGGMSLVPASIRLQPAGAATPHAYAFNCDGLGNLTPGYGSHTQVWNGTAPGNHLVEASGGAALVGTTLQAVGPVPGAVSANLLWNNGNGVQGAGNVRILSPLAL
jgi:hypothetical protein